mgnify:CR=1 FL=1
MRNNNIRRIRLLYGLFASILLICLGLFVCNIIAAEERPQVAPLNPSGIAFSITNIPAAESCYAEEHSVEGTAQGFTAKTHVARYDLDIYSDSAEVASNPRLRWVLVLQLFELAAFAAILVLVIIALISFYRSAKAGRIFPSKNVALLLIIGILLVVTSLCHDTSTYLERLLAFDLVGHSSWAPQVHYSIHFTRIFFGLTLIFLSQIIRIGRELQDEQELTV